MDWAKLLSPTRIRELSGRGASDNPTPQLRSEFERDYDRAVFSTPVRRLQDKAQVYPLEPNDGIRTRLTHSHEVATVSRSLTKASLLAAQEAKKLTLTENQIESFVTIAGTCGLLHDVGNPPFGHAGEQAIQEWFSESNKGKEIIEILKDHPEYQKDLTLFDGNAQTIRLISRLQLINDEFGLNLTCGTMAAATKYVATSSKVDKDGSCQQLTKLGIFSTEAERIKQVRECVGLQGNARHPITFLVEAADDIVYSSVDIEDGLKKGDISWKMLRRFLNDKLKADASFLDAVLRGMLRQFNISGYSGFTEDELYNAVDDLDRDFDQDVIAQVFRVQAIAKVIPAVRSLFVQKLPEIESGAYCKELIEDDGCTAKEFVAACKEAASKHVFPSKEILQLELMGRNIIFDLMSALWEGASIGCRGMNSKKFPGKTYNLISLNYRKVFEEEIAKCSNQSNESSSEDPSHVYHRAKLVVDYIAGMTDTFAQNLHRQLFNG
jgi:dGTPase